MGEGVHLDGGQGRSNVFIEVTFLGLECDILKGNLWPYKAAVKQLMVSVI